MPKVVGCTFATPPYAGSAAVLRHTALREAGMDEFVVYTPQDVEPWFRDHPDLAAQPRGAGLWSWKPWCIRRTLERYCKAGDVVVYADAGQLFLTSIKPYVEATDHVLLFRQCGDPRNDIWTKRQALDAMQASAAARAAPQVDASLQVYRHTPRALALLSKYERWCGDASVMTDPAPSEAQEPGFKAHRHDQSVLTVLAADYPDDVRFAKDASQYGGTSTSSTTTDARVLEFGGQQLVDHYRLPVNPAKVAVITPTVGGRFLASCIASVQAQTLPNVVHYIVVDGPQFEDRVRAAVAPYERRHPIVVLTLPHNVGAGGWNGHRVYGAMPWLLPDDISFVSFLDEDNEMEPDHLRLLLRGIVTSDVTWGHSLRSIIDDDGRVVCLDTCESLGAIAPTVCGRDDRLVDTSCYMLDRNLAIALSPRWNQRARPPGGAMEVDRALAAALMNMPHVCTRQHTLRYRTGSRDDSVRAEFFVKGNAVRGPMDFAAKPDLYVFHFAPEMTAQALTAIREPRSCVLDPWQPSQLKGLAKRFNLLDGYQCMPLLPQGAAVLVTVCAPNTIPWDFFKQRTDLRRMVYTIESPNIRHAAQWDPALLDAHFDRFLTYWEPLLRLPKALACPHNTAFLDLDDPLDAAQLRTNHGVGKSCAMVLERRGLRGTYKVPNIDDVTLTCLEPWREALVLAAGDDVTVFGLGWAEFVAQHPRIKLGHSLSRFEDTRNAVDILQNYTFNLIAENCDAQGYVSEKLYHALLAGCIPLYYGNKPLLEIPEGVDDGLYLDVRALVGDDPTDAASLKKLTAFLEGLTQEQVDAWKARIAERRHDVLRAVGCDAFADIVQKAVVG